jgi:hypothetical protein
LGTIVPDIIGRIPSIIASFFHITEQRWVVPLHTPICLVLVDLLISYLFVERIRKTVFLYLLCGSGIHLFWDILQEQFYLSDYYLFYPLNLYAPKIDLFYYNDTIYLFPLLAIYMIYFIQKTYKIPTNTDDI